MNHIILIKDSSRRNFVTDSEIIVYEVQKRWRIKNIFKKSFWVAEHIILDSCQGSSFDFNFDLQNFLIKNMREYPDAIIKNESNNIKFQQNLESRKILFEKYTAASYEKIYPIFLNSKKRANISCYTTYFRVFEMSNFNIGEKYKYINHPQNHLILNGFEKFIIVEDKNGILLRYPASFFILD